MLPLRVFNVRTNDELLSEEIFLIKWQLLRFAIVNVELVDRFSVASRSSFSCLITMILLLNCCKLSLSSVCWLNDF